MNLLLKDPLTLFYLDSSVGQRVYNILIGLLAPFSYPFGLGWGGYETVSSTINTHFRFSNFILGSTGNVSALALLSTVFGFIYIAFAAYMILLVYKRSNSINPTPYLTLAFLYHAAVFSVAFPPVWFILAFFHSAPNKFVSQSELSSKNISISN